MSTFNSLTMSSRFNLLNIFLVMVTALSVGIIVTYVHLARQFETRQEQGQALATLLAETSEYPVYSRQSTLLDHQVQRLKKVPGISYVVILDENNRILAQMKSQDDPAPESQLDHHYPLTFWQWLTKDNRQHYLEIKAPITSGDFQYEEALFLETQREPVVIGQVKLGINLIYFEETIKQSLGLGFLVMLIILIIGIGISLGLTARITLPLKNLAETAHGVMYGNITPIVLKGGGPELLELGQAFNLMMTWLVDYRAEVESYQSRLKRQAYYDELTGLANRVLLKEQLQLAIQRTELCDSSSALLFLDLDRFKYVNDTLGHSFGDLLLQEVAKSLRNQVRACDFVARMGGDEFIIILNDLSSDYDTARQVVRRVAEKISQVLSQPFNIRGHEISTSFSIGIAICPFDAKDSETLIRNADCAMYEAKAHGRNTYRFYDPSLQEMGLRSLALEAGLKRALEQNEFALNYQPVFDCHTGKLVGAEVLLRWQLNGTPISPVDFIPIAEEIGLIHSIGDWVLNDALKTFADWRKMAIVDANFYIAVNISPRQFWHPNFSSRTLEILAGFKDHERGILELELTESCLLQHNNKNRKTFAELRAAGLRFAIDDFGTGYSNLSYLKQFPLDVLKIDQSFVHDCIEDSSDATIITAIISMAKGLGLEVIAEGVETMEHAAFLKQEGCHLLQGYLLAKPMSAEDFGKFVRNFQRHLFL